MRHQDQPISKKGQEQAYKLTLFFAEKQISAIYISTYQRTGQTIETLAQKLQLTPMVDERLNEIDNGLIDSLTDREIQQRSQEGLEWFC